MRKKKNRPDIEKLRHEVRLLREELKSTLDKIDKQAEVKFKTIEVQANNILTGFVKKISELMHIVETDIQNKNKQNIFRRIWNAIIGGLKNGE